ncbi:MAG: sigma-70 family RNA polymerase sigma factor [Planctomycetes bacterium]|nr:sigma-70 family RNA polymerase sigma factor [Planctomycetota bacterium]MBI3834575.1 sigma-70 family RNA polymerase sigma factor [Planctomycetota bacterium]
MRTSVETPSVEVQLVVRARNGDADAFGELVRIHQRRAVSVAYRLLGNTSDAADAAQDAFVRAFRSLSQLEDPARFSGWLMRIVSNLALNFRRGRATRATKSLDDEFASVESSRDVSTGLRLAGDQADGTDAARETHDAISGALEKLPDKQRLALILFSVEGLPQKEVADILECSVELVKWNVFQARQKLRELLSELL